MSIFTPHPIPSYVPLWCKSNFSFLEGVSHPEDLVKSCRQLAIPALVLSDRNGLHGIVRAHMEAIRAKTPRLIVGSQLTVSDDPEDSSAVTGSLLLIAQTKSGYANLCRLISDGRLRCPKGECRVSWQEVCHYAPGLIALWAGRRHLLYKAGNDHWRHRAAQLRESFNSRLYGLVTRHRLPDDQRIERRLTTLCRNFDIPLAAATEVLYHHHSHRPLQDVVTCIRHRTTLHEAGTLLHPNKEHTLKSPEDFYSLFSDRPELLAATHEIAERCPFSLSELRYRYPSEQLPSGYTSFEWLRRLVFSGARKRYGETVPMDVAKQLNKELRVIDELDYCGYFITMYEIVLFCRNRKILCQGRGSAANSAVCYCLGITAIDPVRMHLLFERFLSKERAEPPDIDLDISHRRREEVIQFVYRKYGRDHAAMIANVIRYRAKSAIRDVGRTLDLPATSINRVTRLMHHHDNDFPTDLMNSLRQAGLDPHSPVHRLLITLAEQLIGSPRHLSIHSGGFLLGSDPISHLVPIENATMERRTVIQWDKHDVEALGLFKVDLLGLGALTHIDTAFELIRRHYGRSYTMATVPPEDQDVFTMISSGDTIGVFQLESRSQMAMLPRMKPKTFYDLVIEIAIIRPGPITGGMVHPYLRRRNGEEPIEYPHPDLHAVLSKTLGIPLFQEQVMQLAMIAANYTPGEADQLRRDMAAWRRSDSIEKHSKKLISRMEAKGISHEFAERIFNQIRGFSEYGFPESHAASFALVSYLTAWLKCHYHDAFTAGLLNAWPMGFYTPATIVDDARRHGIEMRPVDVNRSQWFCTLEPTTRERFAIRIGLRLVKGLAIEDAVTLIATRSEQPFTTVENMVDRLREYRATEANLQAKSGRKKNMAKEYCPQTIAPLPQNALKGLANSGALNSLNIELTTSKTIDSTDMKNGDGQRRNNLWRVMGIQNSGRSCNSDKSLNIDTPELSLSFPPLDQFDTIAWDYSATSMSPRGHPLGPLRRQLTDLNLLNAEQISALTDGKRASYAGIVICRQKPITASGMVFMTLEDETGFVNVMVRPKVFQHYRPIITTASFVGVSGKIQARYDVTQIVADRFWEAPLPLQAVTDHPGDPLPHTDQPLPLKSRDFH